MHCRSSYFIQDKIFKAKVSLNSYLEYTVIANSCLLYQELMQIFPRRKFLRLHALLVICRKNFMIAYSQCLCMVKNLIKIFLIGG